MKPQPKSPVPLEKPLRFKHLTINDGLPHSTVSSVLQDQQGFMWFGTQNGLARYDGYKIIVYQHEHSNKSSLSHNNIFCLVESRDGLLWIGTDLGGVCVFNPRTGRFHTYKNDVDDSESLINDSVWALLEDANGAIWAGTRAGLCRLDRLTNTFTRFCLATEYPQSPPGTVVYKIYQDRSGTIWVGTNGGLFRYNPETDDFTIFSHQPENPQSLSFDNVWAILEDSKGNFWVGTRGGGLNLFDRDTETFKVYKSDPDDPVTISDNKLWDIFEDRFGNLWITTENGGLNRFDYQTETFTNSQHNPNDPYSLSDNDVFRMCEDRSGVFWITTRYKGVNLLVPALQRFAYYRNIPGNPNTIGENNIYSILAEENDDLWIGSFGGGLYKLNHKTGRMWVFAQDHNKPGGILNNKIYHIHRDPTGVLWLATSGGGLNRMDPQDEKFKAYCYSEEQPGQIGSNFLTTIADAGKGRLWVGTLGFGLNLFDTQAGKIVRDYFHNPSDPSSLAEDTIYDLEVDSAGNVWVATARGGLNLLDLQTGRFKRYVNDPENANSILDNTVHALYLDEASQMLWIGTAGGFSCLNLTTQVWKHYTTHDGLPNNTVNGVQPDTNGCLWISTNKGISHFNPKTNGFRNYTAEDGLQSNQFNIASSTLGPDGSIYFGGPMGLTAFHPDQIIPSDYEPSVVLTGFELFNKSVEIGSEILPVPIEYLDKLVLKHDQSVITFEFAALSYQLPEKHLYRYKMEGFDQEWSPPRSIRSATYTNLKRGTYTFRVQACNHDGYWSADQLELKIEILPAWWQTRWFRAGVITTGTLAVGGVMYLRSRRNRKITIQLEQSVEKRTRQLTTEISLRQKAEQELRKINETLQNKLDTITSLQHQLRQQAIRDPLTGLYNRRHLDEFLKLEFARAQRGNYAVAFLLFDLDDFKNINDTYGHHAGDRTLKSLADILTRRIRRSDFACRYGGEEFLVVMPETNIEDAVLRAEAFRSLFEQSGINYEGQTVRTTASFGVAVYPDHGNEQEAILKRVDAALYQAKEAGRNRVVVFSNGG